MTDILRRSIAPLASEAWEEIDQAARQTLTAKLSARHIVSLSGPHGWDYAGVNVGRINVPGKKTSKGVEWGIRQIQPLIETRLRFSLNQWELDNLSRGSKDADLSAVEDAASEAALFEENAIYNGFADGQIKGLIPSSAHKAVKLPADAEKQPEAVSTAVKTLHLAGVAGPYALVLGTDAYFALMQAGKGGYPPRRIIRDLLGGEIYWSQSLAGGVVMSVRGGDFELVLGQDHSIGYASHDKEAVNLFMTESFTFRVLEPAAVIELKKATT